MDRRTGRALRAALLTAGVGVAGGFSGGEARAQGGAPAATAPSGVLPQANPFLNPAVNPFLGSTSSTPDQALLFYYATQRAMAGSTGIGSGRLGGPNAELGRPRTGPLRPGEARPAEPVKGPGTANMPGATASRFFNRSGPAAARPGTGAYYSRQNRHFPANGR